MNLDAATFIGEVKSGFPCRWNHSTYLRIRRLHQTLPRHVSQPSRNARLNYAQTRPLKSTKRGRLLGKNEMDCLRDDATPALKFGTAGWTTTPLDCFSRRSALVRRTHVSTFADLNLKLDLAVTEWQDGAILSHLLDTTHADFASSAGCGDHRNPAVKGQ